MSRKRKQNAPTPRPATPVTLAGVLAALERHGKLSATRKRDLVSAVKRVANLLGNEPAAIALDMAAISARLAAVNPVAVGITTKRLANIRSDFLAAVKASGVMPVKAQSKSPLSPAWVELFARAFGPARPHRPLAPGPLRKRPRTRAEGDQRRGDWRPYRGGSRAIALPAAYGAAPAGGADLERSGARSRARAAAGDGAVLSRAQAHRLGASPQSPSGGTGMNIWPGAASAILLPPMLVCAPWRRGSVRLRRDQIHAAVTALVESGIKPSAIRSLADLVTPDHLKRILRRRLDSVGGAENTFNLGLGYALLQIAHEWVKVDAQVFAELKRLVGKMPEPVMG